MKYIPLSSPLALKEKAYYEKHYSISKYEELPICVVIPSYNNVKDGRYRNNLESILQQDYDNYRIVFIDDASEDGTGAYMWHHVKQRNISPQKLTVIVNKERHMTMPNIHWAAHQFCKPYEIFIIVDGDDELIGKQVFKHINSVYSRTDNWVVYTNFLNMVS